MTSPRLSDIASALNKHLQRLESSPGINTTRESIPKYWRASAYASGRFVYVRYVAFQHTFHLTRAEAVQYLNWLDSGNVGQHFTMKRAEGGA